MSPFQPQAIQRHKWLNYSLEHYGLNSAQRDWQFGRRYLSSKRLFNENKEGSRRDREGSGTELEVGLFPKTKLTLCCGILACYDAIRPSNGTSKCVNTAIKTVWFIISTCQWQVYIMFHLREWILTLRNTGRPRLADKGSRFSIRNVKGTRSDICLDLLLLTKFKFTKEVDWQWLIPPETTNILRFL